MSMFLKTTTMLIFIAVLVWSAFFLAYLNHVHAIRKPLPVSKIDAVVVFTGGANRVTTGLALLEQNISKKLYISGVNPSVTLADILNLDGKNRQNLCCVYLDFEAKSTEANAQKTADWILENKIGSIILVTSDFHMPRALFEFNKKLNNVRVFPHAVKSDKGLFSLAYEFNKYIIVKGVSWFS